MFLSQPADQSRTQTLRYRVKLACIKLPDAVRDQCAHLLCHGGIRTRLRMRRHGLSDCLRLREHALQFALDQSQIIPPDPTSSQG